LRDFHDNLNLPRQSTNACSAAKFRDIIWIGRALTVDRPDQGPKRKVLRLLWGMGGGATIGFLELGVMPDQDRFILPS
jgi:hypothetical protein